ncbi:MAG: hypothetical protein PHQ04_02065 [Opitutaceae bacterium]|nr:hypothetical protein [Opitutaceae bacterium]
MKKPKFNLRSLGKRMTDDLAEVFAKADSNDLEKLCDALLHARRIACFGVGREGLMMQAVCMRLMHAGLNAHYVGDMATPPIGRGDLLFASAGPGHFPTVEALLSVARNAGAQTAVVTAQPKRAAKMPVDLLIYLPAQTMVDVDQKISVMTMGSHYEAAQLLYFDILTIRLLERTNQKRENMYTRYTNLK